LIGAAAHGGPDCRGPFTSPACGRGSAPPSLQRSGLISSRSRENTVVIRSGARRFHRG